MALTIKNLANGQLPNSKTTLYTVPGATAAICVEILLTNETGGDLTANLYANFGSGSRRLSPVNVNVPGGGQYRWKGKLTLEAGDLIEGDASVANDIDYTISGVEDA